MPVNNLLWNLSQTKYVAIASPVGSEVELNFMIIFKPGWFAENADRNWISLHKRICVTWQMNPKVTEMLGWMAFWVPNHQRLQSLAFKFLPCHNFVCIGSVRQLPINTGHNSADWEHIYNRQWKTNFYQPCIHAVTELKHDGKAVGRDFSVSSVLSLVAKGLRMNATYGRIWIKWMSGQNLLEEAKRDFSHPHLPCFIRVSLTSFRCRIR